MNRILGNRCGRGKRMSKADFIIQYSWIFSILMVIGCCVLLVVESVSLAGGVY